MALERRPRIIIHVDLDAFYCQVEQKRHGIPRETPCAVQQWDGLIAVNYAARAAGVTRHMRVAEAKKICPQLRTVHVETIGEGGSTSAGQSQAGGSAGGGSGWRGGGGGGAARRNEVKASLQPYRQASSEIMRVLGGLLGPGCLLEKASVDEAFLDVTPLAEEELQRLEAETADPRVGAPGGLVSDLVAGGPMPDAGDGEGEALARGGSGGVEDEEEDEEAGFGHGGRGVGGGSAGRGGGGGARRGLSAALLSEARRVCEASVVVGGPPDLMNETDRRLLVGGILALRLRGAVRSELDFTCSAGVATNKLLAKVGSARNKPDKQTLVLPRGVHDLMQEMPLGKLRGLGGKLGASLEQNLGATTAGAVQQLPLEQLQRVLGDRTGLWVSQIVRGQCAEPVTPKDKPKSLLSCKSFEPTRDLAELARWLGILAEELATRCREDEAANRRRARTLVLHYRGTGPRERSVRCAMPQHGREGPAPAVLAKAGLEMLRRQPDALPCSRLAIAATEFDDPPATAGRAITRFFAQPRQLPTQPQPQQPTPTQQELAKQHPQQQQQQQQNPRCEHPQQHHDRQRPSAGATAGLRQGGRDTAQLEAWCNDYGEGWCGGGDDDDDQHAGSGEGDLDLDDEYGYSLGPHHEGVEVCAGEERQKEEEGQQDAAGFQPPWAGSAGPSPHHQCPTDPQLLRPRKRSRTEHAGQEQEQEHFQQQQRQQQHLQQPPTQDDRNWGFDSRQHHPQQQPSSLPVPASLSCWLEDGQGRGEGTAEAEAEAGLRPPGNNIDPPGESVLAVDGRGDGDLDGDVEEEAMDQGGDGVGHGRDGVQQSAEPPSGWRGATSSGRDAAAAPGDASAGCLREELRSGAEMDPDADPGPGAPSDILSDVDLDEQRRILHEIDLARLRAVGRVSRGGGRGGMTHSAAGAAGRRGGGVGGMGGGGRGGRGRATATAKPVKGQMRLTVLLQRRSGKY